MGWKDQKSLKSKCFYSRRKHRGINESKELRGFQECSLIINTRKKAAYGIVIYLGLAPLQNNWRSSCKRNARKFSVFTLEVSWMTHINSFVIKRDLTVCIFWRSVTWFRLTEPFFFWKIHCEKWNVKPENRSILCS